jgi:anti-sigma B factor antagonist
MKAPSAKLLVMVGERFACIRIIGRANFTSRVDFKALVDELRERGCGCFVLNLSECVLMDSTFLGVLAGFGLKMNATASPDQRGIELSNPNARITELLENLGALSLFKIITGPMQLPDGIQTCSPEPAAPSREEITRTSLEAHQTLMAMNPDNVARFKDVAQFMAEDLKNLEKGE